MVFYLKIRPQLTYPAPSLAPPSLALSLSLSLSLLAKAYYVLAPRQTHNTHILVDFQQRQHMDMHAAAENDTGLAQTDR